ncbi:hypothetical protein BSK63_17410 [Paenibacillus odorifer]|nr:hypothetical protein BSK63_17410 [Paenibacillus odorifer]
MYRKIFKKQGKPLRYGDQIITTSSFFAIVNPVKTNFKNRDKFLNNFAKQAYIHGLSTVKKPSHVLYWYDGPFRNQGVDLWNDGAYHRTRKGVVGISALFLADSEETIELAKKAVHVLIENNNLVLLLPEYAEEFEMYKMMFPDAVLLNEEAGLV